jgi:hypothetical protein
MDRIFVGIRFGGLGGTMGQPSWLWPPGGGAADSGVLRYRDFVGERVEIGQLCADARPLVRKKAKAREALVSPPPWFWGGRQRAIAARWHAGPHTGA